MIYPTLRRRHKVDRYPKPPTGAAQASPVNANVGKGSTSQPHTIQPQTGPCTVSAKSKEPPNLNFRKSLTPPCLCRFFKPNQIKEKKSPTKACAACIHLRSYRGGDKKPEPPHIQSRRVIRFYRSTQHLICGLC